LRRDVVPRTDFVDTGEPFPFRHVEGEGIFEITVGPVHAGIIEPGHFRFSVEGETIVNLETRFGFVHKGTEKLFEGLALDRAPALAERSRAIKRRPRLAHARRSRRCRRESCPGQGCGSSCSSWSGSTTTWATWA
jgi:hypothetical protein